MKNRKTSLFPLVLLISGCTADDASLDELSRVSPAEITTEQSPESELSDESDEDIEIIYREATASLEVVVDVDKLTRAARGSTIEMKIDVTTPDGVTTRHDLNWTSGEGQDVPRIEAPVVHDGPYEVVVTELAVDGRVLEGALTQQRLRMDVRGDVQPQAALGDDGHDDDGDHDGGDHDDDDDDDDGDWDDGDHDDDDGDWEEDGGHNGKKCKKGKTKHGGDYGDKLHGSDRNDKIYGYGGRDKLWGYECNDELYGGKGNDTLRGGKGRDFLHGGKGEDRCEGGAGKDEFRSCEYIQ